MYNTEFYGFDIADKSQIQIFGGCQDLSNFSYGASGFENSWLHLGGGDGGNCIIDDTNSAYVYFTEWLTGRLYRSSDGGATYLSTGANPWRKSQVVLSPTNSNILYLGATGGIRIYSNIRVNWNYVLKSPPGIDNNRITALEIDKNNSNIIYTSSNGYANVIGHPNYINYVWKSTDNGGTWTSISHNFTNNPNDNPCRNGYVTDIEINPKNSNEIWVCFGRATNGIEKVFHSEDGGLTWNPLSFNYPAENIPALAIQYDEIGDLLYVATDVGIFFFDEINGWNQLGIGLPKKLITDIELNFKRRELWVSTLGRGIWVVELPDEHCYFSNQEDILYLHLHIGMMTKLYVQTFT